MNSNPGPTHHDYLPITYEPRAVLNHTAFLQPILPISQRRIAIAGIPFDNTGMLIKDVWLMKRVLENLTVPASLAAHPHITSAVAAWSPNETDCWSDRRLLARIVMQSLGVDVSGGQGLNAFG